MATRRGIGVTRGIAYGEDTSTEIDFTNADGDFFDSAYDSSVSLSGGEIDVTAYGDFPFKATERGFLDISINLSMRHQTTNGALAEDLEFLINHTMTGTPIRIAILDDRRSATPNGWIFTASIMSFDEPGALDASQDHNFVLKRTAGTLPDKRIKGGTATVINYV